MILINECLNFWSNWLYSTPFSDLTYNLIWSIEKWTVRISNIDIVNLLGYATCFFLIWFAIWLIKWFVNFIFGLVGGYND